MPLVFLVSAGLAGCGHTRALPDAARHIKTLPVPDTLEGMLIGSGNSRLRKNTYGIWEMYVEGNPLERGLANGCMSAPLIQAQEDAFISQIRELIPSDGYLKILRRFLQFFNRHIADHITEEYKTELYGLSAYASHKYDFIARPYWRMLYFHGAHDIGHALQDLALVGCTSFAAWGEQTDDGTLLIGRNFDFYAGDNFSKEKVILFIHPDSGYRHAIVTWPGMIGAVSGMNETGLTVTMNAGKSSMPLKAKTPVSILAREILQYASNIAEAKAITAQREVFVSESLLIGSASDGQAVILEISPNKSGIFLPAPNSTSLICTNHFQSETYKKDKKNLKHQQNSHSVYRYEKMQELLQTTPPLTPALAADILRNREGLEGRSIGYGNEKAINQLLAHHGVIFKPEEKRMWVSAPPYQLGTFISYQLDSIFSLFPGIDKDTELSEPLYNIPADSFLYTQAYRNYETYRIRRKELTDRTVRGEPVTQTFITTFEQLNPDFWETYYLLGRYFYRRKDYKQARWHYRMALSKEIPTEPDRDHILKLIRKCSRKITRIR